MANLYDKPKKIVAEEAILYCLLTDPRIYFEFPPELTPDCFSAKNKPFYEEIIARIEEKLPVDEILARCLRGGHHPEKVLADYCEFVVPANFMYYVNLLLDYHRLDCFKLALKEAQFMLKQGHEVDEVIEFLQSHQAWEGRKQKDAVVKVTEIKQEHGEIVKTGFWNLDQALSLRPGNLVILASETGVGKTTFALNLANNFASQGKTVLIHSFEMTEEEILLKLKSMHSRYTLNYLMTHPEEDVEIPGGDNIFVNAKGLDLRQALKLSRDLKKRHDLSLIIVDYLQIAAPHIGDMTRAQQVGLASRRWALLAKELGCLILLISSLTRETKGKKPKLHHLKESGDIEYHADVVLFLVSSGEQEVSLIIAKSRMAGWKNKTIYFRTDFKHSKFYELL